MLRSTLAPGQGPGASVLVVEARYKAVTSFTDIGNVRADTLGRSTASLGIDLNSPAGYGEVLYSRTFGLPITGGHAVFLGAEPRNRALATGLILPLGSDGLTLEATDTRTTPRVLPGSVGFASELSRFSARLRYPHRRAAECQRTSLSRQPRRHHHYAEWPGDGRGASSPRRSGSRTRISRPGGASSAARAPPRRGELERALRQTRRQTVRHIGRSGRRALAERIGRDGHALLAAVFSSDASAWLREIPAVIRLGRV